MKYIYSRNLEKIYEIDEQVLESMKGFEKFAKKNKPWVNALNPLAFYYATGIEEVDEEEALEHPLLLARRLFIRQPISKDNFIVAVQLPRKNSKDDYFQIDAFSASKLELDDYHAKRFEKCFKEKIKKGRRFRLQAKTRQYGERDMSYFVMVEMGEINNVLEFEKGKLKAHSSKGFPQFDDLKKELLEERQKILSTKFGRNATEEEFNEAVAKLKSNSELLEQSNFTKLYGITGLIAKAIRAQGTEFAQYFRNKIVYEAFKNVDKNKEEANKFLELEEAKE